MIGDWIRKNSAGVLLLAGVALILAAGAVMAIDGARTFTAGSCPGVFNGTYGMYCDFGHYPPPPACRDTVRLCIGDPSYPSNATWAVNCPVVNETTIYGPVGYYLDYSFVNQTGFPPPPKCLSYEVAVGAFDESEIFEGYAFKDGIFCLSNSTISEYITGQPIVLPGGRLGATFTVFSPINRTQGVEGGVFVDGDFTVACVDLKMNSSFYFNTTSSDPPYPICRGESVPTLSQWGMLLMSLGIALCGVWAVRRRVARSR